MFSWFKATVAIYSIVCSYAEELKCLKLPESRVERHFSVNGHDLPLRIEVSSRKSHQLVSNIVKILLNEVIGYRHVHLIQQDKSVGDNAITTFKKISSCRSPKDCSDVSVKGPELMINLEVWLPPDYNIKKWTATGEMEDVGPLGPVGRGGWYVAEYTVSYFWESNNTVIDHWRAFTNPEVVKHFDLTNEDVSVIFGRSYCTLKECGIEGIYRPKQCLPSGVRCATLLADYPASILERTKLEIIRLGLLVNVAFVGEQLDIIVEKRTADGRNTLFYHRKPMTLSSISNFVRVSFQNGRDEAFSKCGFEVYQLEKIIWPRVRTHAPEAFRVLQSISFSQSEYVALLKSYVQAKNQGFSIRDIACRWVRDNVLTWDKWIPINHRNKTALYIGGIFSITGIYWRQKSVYKAARMAADAINSNNSILPNYHLEILSQDGQCSADEVMKSFINYVTNATFSTMVGILGPACSDTVEPLAGVAKHFNSIIVSYSAEGTLFRNREKYPYFFQTIPENNQFRNVYLKLFQRLGFSKVAALTEDGQKYTEYVSRLQDSMQARGMTFIVNLRFSRESGNSDLTFYLKELKNKGAKIIIGDFYDYAARSVMCAAYKLKMTAANGYVWFLPFWFTSSNPYEAKAKASGGPDQVSCTPEQMVEAASGHISLSHKFYADPDSVMQEGKTVKSWIRRYRDDHSKDTDVSRYGGYAYDAVWVYATALDALFKENKSHITSLHTERTSRRLMEHIQHTNFTGVTGPLYFLGSSRISDVVITQWVNREYREIGVYRPITQNEGVLDLDEEGIQWLTPGGVKPDNEIKELSNCSVEVLRLLISSTCEVAVIVANGLSISMFLISMCIVGFIFKLRYDEILRRKERRWIELDLMEKNRQFAIDEWEMPRDHIVINRKLGEGAFGTVYGGEANIKDLGWIAVAVKTLKNGAKPEEKLNFLSEAEIMKQLDHINIVKLVGVCTTSEPVYTVMEFMLYGDLKTYLLSRRSIVAKNDRVSRDEVSDRRLTTMALDIARGLSYLASKKYVHRDLACRNCLVNISRSVKIADFGMCRAMYDSDYYRLNKLGMLPVRWMAPESLIDGLFTPMSDVWSYGVILYEIITFASIPYQGLSDNEVLRHIKNFKLMSVPKGIKPQLHNLLLRCWSRLPKQRPPATEIVEFLANNPELISPCLDVPTSSVQVMDTCSPGFSHLNRTRGHSLSSVWQNRKNIVSVDNVHVMDPPKLPSNAQERSVLFKPESEYYSQITIL